ncbi:MAG: FAD:protein FMN transferase [Actinomycetota bacterium]|nr:FAD:protein FMN transferase [Actinomycetota bacterium]
MADRTFKLMGGRARISVDDRSAHLVDELVLAAAGLEASWSRFDASSEISQLNRASGAPVIVSPETADLLDKARVAHHATGGWFDPLMLNELAAAGYNESFELLGAFGASRFYTAERQAALAEARPSMTDADIDSSIGLVQLPEGSAFDPGGIGKGLAADRLARAALDAGAEWVIVDMGGDVRVDGEGLQFGEFQVEVGHPDGGVMCMVAMTQGAAATSGTSRRRWRGPLGEQRHHLLDPRTGRPAESDLSAVTVIAAEAWWAEAVATATVVAGRERGLQMVSDLGLAAIAIDTAGAVQLCGDVEDFIL